LISLKRIPGSKFQNSKHILYVLQPNTFMTQNTILYHIQNSPKTALPPFHSWPNAGWTIGLHNISPLNKPWT